MNYSPEMTEAELVAEMDREDAAARDAFTTKWMDGIPHVNMAGGTTGVFIYAASLEDAKRIEDSLNAKGVTNTDIHKSYEPECGEWVCQASERNEFTYTGGTYAKMITTLKEMCESMGIIPKYTYVDCNQCLINFKTEEQRAKFVKIWKTNTRMAGDVQLDDQYHTTFQFRWFFK